MPQGEVEMVDSWWGSEDVEVGTTLGWTLGPLKLAVRRSAREWNLAHCWQDTDDSGPGWSFDGETAFPEEAWEIARFVFSRTDSVLELVPALADRPVITSPRIPLFVSPGESTTLFVGSPLWVRLRAEGEQLLEVPIQRPTDTWFGPSTREGELCYAARTRAVVDPDNISNLPLLARRAVTPVVIHNRADSALQIERLKLPVPYLSLFATDAGRVWTETMEMERAESSEMAEIEVKPGAPSFAAGARLLSEPREQPEETLAVRAFSTVSSLLRAIGGDND